MVFNKVKIVTMVPVGNVDSVRNAICDSGAGIIGNYTYCTTSTKCIGTFIPNKKATPYIGKNDKLEFVDEVRLEVTCDSKKTKEVVARLNSVHPYEEPSIDIYPLLDLDSFK